VQRTLPLATRRLDWRLFIIYLYLPVLSTVLNVHFPFTKFHNFNFLSSPVDSAAFPDIWIDTLVTALLLLMLLFYLCAFGSFQTTSLCLLFCTIDNAPVVDPTKNITALKWSIADIPPLCNGNTPFLVLLFYLPA
jgi:hypothetical protein